jgi:hypothetical protein
MITDRVLEDYLKCHSKAHLRRHGRTGEAHQYLALCSRLDARYHADASLWLSTRTTTGGANHFGRSLLQDMTTTDAIILDAVGAANGLETHFHALQGKLGDSHLGPYHYQPIRFCRQPQPNAAVYLLLAFDAVILGDLQGISPEVGVLLCGPTFKRKNIRLRTHLDSLAIILARFEPSAPMTMNRHSC